MNIIWQEFLKIVREEAGSRVVETWFKAVSLLKWDEHKKTVYLIAPNNYVQQWIKNHYLELIKKHLGRLLNENTITIVFTESLQPAIMSPASEQPETLIYKPAQSLMVKQPYSSNTHTTSLKTIKPRSLSINSIYLFDTFIVGPNNTLAFSAAHAVAEKPGKLYNPLFIYGASGLGKTHLLHAIGNHIQKSFKKINILYQSADRFVHEFINAIRFDKINHFEAKYKDLDLLLVDDIQFISNKEQTQEAFFHIFNMLHQAQKQIVFTSDTLPCDIAGLAERMKSRLEGGLIADIQIPQYETKIAILKQKAEKNNECLSDEVAHYIATYPFYNIRELEGALIRISAYASLTHQPITKDLAHKVLIKKQDDKKSIDLQKIMHHIARHFNYTQQELKSAKRNKDLVMARHIAMYFMKKLTHHSLKEISAFLDRSDHSTVIHAFDKIESCRQVDNNLCQTLTQIEKEIVT
ncbi:MAG: chromosomal replication initiator protein DnaA [Candidatus Babeliaceae bacterium]|jgi:chromosomal replication initiator protein